VRFVLRLPKSTTGKAGLFAGGIIGGLIALDLLALVATAVFAATGPHESITFVGSPTAATQ
jgi:hypothetical protein